MATGGPDAQHAQAGWLVPERVTTFPEKVAGTLTTRYYKGVNTTVDDGALAVSFRKSKRARSTDDDETWVQEEQTNTLNCFDTGETRSTQLVAFALQPNSWGEPAFETDVAPTLTSSQLGRGSDRGARVVSATGEVAHTLTASGFDASEDGTGRGWPTIVEEGEWGVRRLTPVECERLQGFPDHHTAERWDWKKSKVVPQSDSARGHQIGNAVAVPVIAWIARRMTQVAS
jgi:DNA (cytosine-5)-methyltransferase 1